MNADLKYKVISLLQQPTLTAKMISEELDLSYGAVMRVEKEFNTAKLNGTLDQLLDVDDMVLTSAAGTLELDKDALVKGLNGLERLSADLTATADHINKRVRSLVMSAEHMSELSIATDIICALNTSFVNPNKTQVNVQNNFGAANNASSRYNAYLSDKPAD